jgi:shikimate dehydrogenase
MKHPSDGAVVLIGDPVDSSPSPVIHNAAFRELGLNIEYTALTVRSDGLPAAFQALRAYALGLNVTAPLKEAIIPYLDSVSGDASHAGSVNTVRFDDGHATGASTDGPGFMAAVGRAGAGQVERAMVLGTGGAARAVAWELASTGASVVTCGRNVVAGARLASDLTVSASLAGRAAGTVTFVPYEPATIVAALEDADLLVNATPVGAWPRTETHPLPPGVHLPSSMTVCDLVYRPRRTRLLQLAESFGCALVEGVEMLVEQAARSFAIWTGCEPPVGVMRATAYEALDAPALAPATTLDAWTTR